MDKSREPLEIAFDGGVDAAVLVRDLLAKLERCREALRQGLIYPTDILNTLLKETDPNA